MRPLNQSRQREGEFVVLVQSLRDVTTITAVAVCVTAMCSYISGEVQVKLPHFDAEA